MKSVKLKDKALQMYAAYSICRLFQIESSEAYRIVLELSKEIQNENDGKN